MTGDIVQSYMYAKNVTTRLYICMLGTLQPISADALLKTHQPMVIIVLANLWEMGIALYILSWLAIFSECVVQWSRLRVMMMVPSQCILSLKVMIMQPSMSISPGETGRGTMSLPKAGKLVFSLICGISSAYYINTSKLIMPMLGITFNLWHYCMGNIL